MSRYAVTFKKEGYARYTSHLDMLRLFKRAVKKGNIQLIYSQGYNPHPKIGFAQPLSLGYESLCEILELETRKEYSCQEIVEGLSKAMPEGISIAGCVFVDDDVKSIAALCDNAEYLVTFPLKKDEKDFEGILKNYLNQEAVFADKRQKKTKKIVSIDIKSKIRKIEIIEEELLTMKMDLDSGSISNLSPEQVISSFVKFAELDCDRSEIRVTRTHMGFVKNFQF